MGFETRTYLARLAALGLVVCSIGCGATATTDKGGAGASKEPARTYVGRTDSVRIGLVTQGNNLLAYICSADETFNKRNCQWVAGKLSSEGAAEMNHDHGLKLAVEVKGDKAKGALTTAEGKTLEFQAVAVPDDGIAGVYRVAFPNGNKLGWIVDDTGFVGGIAMKEGDSKALGSWELEPGVKLKSENLRGMISLSYNKYGFVSAQEIERVVSPSP